MSQYGAVLLVVLFVRFGWSKLTGFSGTVDHMAATGAPAPELSAVIAVVMELVVGCTSVAVGTPHQQTTRFNRN